MWYRSLGRHRQPGEQEWALSARICLVILANLSICFASSPPRHWARPACRLWLVRLHRLVDSSVLPPASLAMGLWTPSCLSFQTKIRGIMDPEFRKNQDSHLWLRHLPNCCLIQSEAWTIARQQRLTELGPSRAPTFLELLTVSLEKIRWSGARKTNQDSPRA